MSRLGGNLLLLAFTSTLTLIGLELAFRVLVEPEQLVPNVPTHPHLNERRNELRFYTENRHRKPESLGSHDPWLGWDSTYRPGRARGLDSVGEKHGLRVVAVGDSFVYGNEVAEDENFTALLDGADNGLEALNLGVPGYGIDQSWLKLERHGLPLDPDIVLFGIYVADYERATVAFTAGAKPCYRTSATGVTLTNQPVPSPAESLARIAGSLERRSYLLAFVANRLAALPDRTATYFTEADELVGHVLGLLAAAVLPKRRLLVVHIPRGESFTESDGFHETMDERLLTLYRTLALPYLDLRDEFLAIAPSTEVARLFYVIRDGGSIGHLNPEGHRVAARAIAHRLGLPAPPDAPWFGSSGSNQYDPDRP